MDNATVAFLFKEPIILIYFLSYIFLFLDDILIKKYSKYKGFYVNGIVDSSFIEWKNIFSWKKIDEDKISFLTKEGKRFDMETNLKQELVIDFIKKKNIQEDT